MTLPTDGYLDPSRLTYALADGARRGGCRILTHTRVTGIAVRTEVAVEVFGEWVEGEVAAEPLFDPEGTHIRGG